MGYSQEYNKAVKYLRLENKFENGKSTQFYNEKYKKYPLITLSTACHKFGI